VSELDLCFSSIEGGIRVFIVCLIRLSEIDEFVVIDGCFQVIECVSLVRTE